MTIPATTIAHLLASHDGLLFDAHGVLLDDAGPLPGASALIDHLNAIGYPYCILTNSASQLPETKAEHFRRIGLQVPVERILSSGELLESWFAECGLIDSPTVVLGPTDSQIFAERAGARLVPLSAHCDAEVVVIADEKGYPLLEHLDHVLSLLLRRLDAGKKARLVVCNPDLLYPQGVDHFGFTAGALAAMFEGVLTERYGPSAPSFTRLGKPYAPVFEEATRRLGTRRLAMIGDQLVTDIAGANRFGITSVWIATGLGAAPVLADELRPDFRLETLAMRG